jgi:hypothetical protein
MPGLKTSYEFTLPRGFVDHYGGVHRTGRMRLATARDELEPLRDPQVTGPDDPRLTILVLARVVEYIGDVRFISADTIEGLFAVDLAFLQDFYGVINFGTQAEYDALLGAQSGQGLVGTDEEPDAEPEPEVEEAPVEVAAEAEAPGQAERNGADNDSRPPITRATVEEMPRMAQ